MADMLNTSQIDIIESPTYISESRFGKGVFAGKDFSPGELILTFTGEIIDFNSTIMSDEQDNGYPLQIGQNKYIDLMPDARYLNHSCQPNAAIQLGNSLHAIMHIRRHDEIFFDYSTSMDEGSWTLQCKCGSVHCRTVVGDFCLLPDYLQATYLSKGYVTKFISQKFALAKEVSA